VVAGYPWFGRWGRDTFIALPGLTLAGCYDPKACKEVLDTMVAQMQNGLFPNIGEGASAAFNAADAPLWFFGLCSNTFWTPASVRRCGMHTAML
jgi:glycogen debranching enzyme